MDQKTIDTYNRSAEEYDKETADFWDRFPKTILDKFVELVGRGKILDVGSGPGRDGLILRERGLDVTCLDASEEMVKRSRAKGLLSVLGDFNALPFSDGSFDGVWSYTALLHIPKKEIDIPIKEIFRVLKRGGVFGLGLIDGATEGYRHSSGVNMPRLFSFYTRPELEVLLARNHFQVAYFEQFQPKSKNYLNFISRKI